MKIDQFNEGDRFCSGSQGGDIYVWRNGTLFEEYQGKKVVFTLALLKIDDFGLCETLDARCRRLEQEAFTRRQSYASLEANHAQLDRWNREAVAEKKGLEKQINNQSNIIEVLSKRINGGDVQRINDQIAKIEDLTKEIATLEAANARLVSRVNNLAARNDDLVTRVIR